MSAMEEFINSVSTIWHHPITVTVVTLLVYLIIGIVLTLVISKLLKTITARKRMPARVSVILNKALTFVLWVIVITQALHSVGVNIISLLGAAGVAGVAIGFASQTALSNMISGVFLLSERTVRVGDYIRVNGQEGTVLEINFLSITLRQADNALIRIPCELLIKEPLVNVTSRPLRRCDLDIGVDYASDLDQVRKVILGVFRDQPLIADTPAPAILFSGFGDSSLNLHIGAWCKTENYHQARFDLAQALLVAFRREGINIPFPVRTILTPDGSESSAPANSGDPSPAASPTEAVAAAEPAAAESEPRREGTSVV